VSVTTSNGCYNQSIVYISLAMFELWPAFYPICISKQTNEKKEQRKENKNTNKNKQKQNKTKPPPK